MCFTSLAISCNIIVYHYDPFCILYVLIIYCVFSLFTGIIMLSRFAQLYLQRFGSHCRHLHQYRELMELITSNLPSAKSSIQVLGQEMSLWPPIGVSLPDDDCAFQDTTAPLCLDHIPVLGVSFVGKIQGQIACSSSFT